MVKRCLILLSLVVASIGFASVEVQCKVDGLQRSVQFATGSELNQATRTYNYQSYSVYALLWYSQNQVAILKHSGYAFGITGTFDHNDLDRLFNLGMRERFTQVNGSSSRSSFIECKSYGRWIDPRLR